MKKTIGIVDIAYSSYRSYFFDPYIESLDRAGSSYQVLGWDMTDEQITDAATSCDGFLFTGGVDIEPLLYGEERLPQCGEASSERDDFERKLFSTVFSANKPILGICRGCQSINVWLGGTLWQDIPTQLNSTIAHRGAVPSSIKEELHPVTVFEGSKLYSAFGSNGNINSAHHQAIKALGSGLVCVAEAPDGIIEAVEHTSHPWLVAVQWHPEHLSCRSEANQNIFRAFLNACNSKT